MQKIPAKEVATDREVFGASDLDQSLKEIKGQKFMDYVNVKDFGAKGDGVTDDKEAFKNAISFLKNINGGVLYLPKGNYILNFQNTFEIDFNNINIIGNGINNSKLTINGTLRFGDNNNYYRNLSLENFSITSGNSTGNVIEIMKFQKNVSLNKIEFIGMQTETIALYCDDIWGMLLQNSHFYHCGRSFQIQSGANAVTILNNYFWNSKRENIVISNSSNVNIIGNSIETYGLNIPGAYLSVLFQENCKSITIKGNWLENPSTAANHKPLLRIQEANYSFDIINNTFFLNKNDSYIVDIKADKIRFINNNMLTSSGLAHVNFSGSPVFADFNTFSDNIINISNNTGTNILNY